MAVKEFNKECCGCGACVDICPKKAISMQEDQETFRYPFIDHNKCINCGLCEKTCPIFFSEFINYEKVKPYVGIYKSKDVIYNSSSGGAFTAIYQSLLKKEYVIYGAQYTENLRVTHGRAISEKECELFRKSKYIQSDSVGCFQKVEDDLRSGRKVCFSGVSCQCAALISYLNTKKIDRNNLLTVNILCHGVPSQTIFNKYLDEEYKEATAPIYIYQFKNKEALGKSVNSRTAFVEFSDGHRDIRTRDNDPFLRGYYSRLFYRPSCGTCHFARKERITDITIADAWNIEKIKPNYKPIEGVSLILFNTEKAQTLIGEINNTMELEDVPLEWAITSQRLFRKPTRLHKNRDKFFVLWHKTSFRSAVFECTKLPLKQRLFRKIPNSIRSKIKAVLNK